ncbi:MAG TPA: hypothetical protein VLV18_09320 [Terriglobales bacterium]|nr:hypothetical protein [Terriglobales bacterium]
MGVLLYGFFSNPGFLIYNPSSITLSLVGDGVAFSLFIAGFVIYFLSPYIRKTQSIDLTSRLKRDPT